LIVQLAASPEYYSLSYVWGSIADPKTITLNGQPFRVTQNLEAALIQLRSADEDQMIWVDALAINQCDISERNIQVQIMRDIYATANMTIAWLGQGVDIINTFFFMLMAMMFEPEKYRDGMPSSSDLLKFSIIAMAELADAPYWKRVWVVQEVVYSKSVLLRYGETGVPMDFFLGLWDNVCSLTPMKPDPRIIENDGVRHAHAISKVHNMFLKPLRPGVAQEGNFFNYHSWVLEFCMAKNCYDPCDMVYGFYGCFPPEVRQQIVIDYQRSTEDLYAEVTRVWLEFRGDLASLDVADIYRRTTTPGLGLPSWAMNYTKGDPPLRFVFSPLQTPSDCSKSFHFNSDGRILHAKAFRVGTITKCSGLFEIGKGEVGDWSVPHARLIEHSEHCKNALEVTETDLDTFALAFGGSRLGRGRLDELKSFLNPQQRQGQHSGQYISNIISIGATHHTRLMFTITMHPSVLDSHVGCRGTDVVQFGLGPCEMSAGDEVFFLRGSSYALVLRRSEEYYIRIGSAFVPNIEQYWEMFVDMDTAQLMDISLC
jgi:hypothetical protein